MENDKLNEENKIIWLASYPKSGNTWFRVFLTALLNDGDLDINEIKLSGIFSSKPIVENFTDLDPAYLYDSEAKVLQTEVFTYMEQFYQKKDLFVKIHDAYTYTNNSHPLVPSVCTRCALYFIRNPLDVVGSFANHIGGTIDDAIRLMNKPHGALSAQPDNFNINNQFKQLMLSWSGHVESWTGNIPFPVMVLRYEDMITDTLTTFSKALTFMGIQAENKQIEAAIAACSFEQLQKKEQEEGFHEKSISSPVFFRKGQAGNWKSELNAIQVNSIISNHEKVMTRYGYL
jgi:hypothetical protein